MATEPWGVKVERVEVKDVRVPAQLMRAMAAEAEAAREARAKVIAAEGEHKASRALRHAAEVITDSPAALQENKYKLSILTNISFLQLRYLQTLNSISAENNSTVVFPVPIDIMSSFMQMNTNNQSGLPSVFNNNFQYQSVPKQQQYHQNDSEQQYKTVKVIFNKENRNNFFLRICSPKGIPVKGNNKN